MKIPLPQNYSFKDIAKVKDEILYIYKLGFEDLMYNLTYSIKDSSKCYYCSTPLCRDKATLDHMYPRNLGGPTLPNNLCISCADCNNTKTNMTEQDFWFYLSLSEEKQDEFIRDVTLKNHINKKWYGPIIEKDWICQEPIEKIIVYFFFGTEIPGKSYKKIEKDYKKYRHIIRPIIVDKHFKLLDGFSVLLFAKNNSISFVPTIVLENVELV